MTPQTTPKPRSRMTRVPVSVLLAGALLAFVAIATPANAVAPAMVTICHATASETNPYVSITIAPQAVIAAHIDHQDDEDVIPEFTYANVTYSQNLDAAGLALLANDCEEPGTNSTSSSSSDPPSEEVPVFTSPLALLAGVGGALGGSLLLLRRKL